VFVMLRQTKFQRAGILLKNLVSSSEPRDPLKAIGLAFLFGPLGLMYANVALGLVFIPILFTSIYFGGPFWGVVTHFGGILIAGLFTVYSNEKLELSSTAAPKLEHGSAPAVAQSGESLVSIGGTRGSETQSAVLVRCPTCNAEISSKALSCPRCGHPISAVSQNSRYVDGTRGTTALAQRIAAAVSDGARVESQNDSTAVLVYGNPVNHVLHLLLGVFTCGLWWLVWGFLGLTASSRNRRVVVTLDAAGRIHEERADIPRWRRMSFGSLLLLGVVVAPVVCMVGSHVPSRGTAPVVRDPAVTEVQSHGSESPEALQPKPDALTPRHIASDYRSNPVAADAQYNGKLLQVIGVVELVRKNVIAGTEVSLATGPALQSVSCHFDGDQDAAIATIQPGQLIAVRGKGIGKMIFHIGLTDCEIYWLGDDPKVHRRTAGDFDRRLALSYYACLSHWFPGLEGVLERNVLPDGGVVPKKMRRQIERFENIVSRAEEQLKDVGGSLPCDHPMLAVIRACDGGHGPECDTRQFKSIWTILKKEEAIASK
jgi:hypothetical protein